MSTLTLDLLPDYKIARESYAEVLDDIKLLLPEHKAELALYDDIPLDPEYEVYETLDRLKQVSIYTVRVSKKLVGYAIYFVRKNPHYKGFVWATNDIVLIRKSHRRFGLGNALFSFIERDLREQGAHVIHTTAKTAHPELEMLLESRGHRHVEAGYSKRL